MNHITRFKRRTRIMWLIVVLVWVAVLSALGNMAEPEPDLHFTDSDVGCINDCLDPPDNLYLSIREGE